MKKKVEKIIEEIKKDMGDEEFQKIVRMTIMLGTLHAIKETKSLDLDILAEYLYKEKNEVMPVENFKHVIAGVIPQLKEEKFLNEDGTLTQVADFMQNDYYERLLKC